MVDRLRALKAGRELDFIANKEPKCPHCGDDFDIQYNEAWHLYDENDTHTVECPGCENKFNVNSFARWSFSTDEQEDD